MIAMLYLVALILFEVHADTPPPPAPDIPFNAEQRQWLDGQRQITVGVMANWPPISQVDDQGEARGIDIDILEQLNARLGGRLVIKHGPWNQIYRAIQAGKMDLVMGVTPRDFRRTMMNFSTPYMKVPHVIVARSSSAVFYDNEEDLKFKTVALEKDFVNVHYFRNAYPEARISTYANTLAALEAVSRGDADAYAGNRVVVLHLIEEQKLSNLRIHGRLSKPATELAIGSRKDLPYLDDIVQRALDSIGPGGLRRIINAWIPTHPSREIRYDISLTDEERQWLRDHPGLGVGLMSNWPPFDFIDEKGRARGIGRDILTRIEKALDYRFDIRSGSWQNLYRQVQQAELELIFDITPKPEREEDFHFTSPYLDIPHVIVAPSSIPLYQSESDLAGKTLALESGFGNVDYFRRNYPGTQVKQYANTEDALEAVSRGDADAYAGNRVVALYLIEKLALANLRVHGRLKKPGSVLSIGARKDYPILRDIMQKALNAIGPRDLKDIKNNWIYLASEREQPDLVLNEQERSWLLQHPVIPIGVDGAWPPIDFLDDGGRHAGITADYLKLIGQKLGIRFDPRVSADFKSMLAQVASGELKVGASISFTDERNKELLFTQAFFRAQKVIVTNAGAPGQQNRIQALEDLHGKRVSVEQAFLTMHQLQEKHPQIRLVPVASTRVALEKLSWGEVDAYIGNQAVVSWLSRKHQFSNLRIINDARLGSSPQNFAISRAAPDWAILAKILDKALASITIEEQLEIEHRWLQTLPMHDFDIPPLRLNNELQKWLQKHPRLRLGIDTQWPPLEFLDDNDDYQGLSSEFMRYFARQAGFELIPPEDISWKEVLQRLKDRHLDAAPCL